MYDDLIKRLRNEAETERYLLPHSDNGTAVLLDEAADAIEELSAIREEQKAQIIAMAAEDKPPLDAATGAAEGGSHMKAYLKTEMPKNCWDCPLINTSPCPCKGYSIALEHTTNRHPDCPLVPVPPHGRLIDADAAIADIRGEILEHQMNGMKGTPFYIEDLRTMWQRLEDEEMCPTIIPAEEGE